VLRLCDKIMGEKFRAVFLQYRLLKMKSTTFGSACFCGLYYKK
jgi:hypothetical protein